jgi:hypothetical protein
VAYRAPKNIVRKHRTGGPQTHRHTRAIEAPLRRSVCWQPASALKNRCVLRLLSASSGGRQGFEVVESGVTPPGLLEWRARVAMPPDKAQCRLILGGGARGDRNRVS